MKQKVKLKKCRNCKENFKQFQSMQAVCSPKCAREDAEKRRERKENKELITFRQDRKSLSKWISEAQSEINAYVRIRDHNDGCISCRRKPDSIHLRGSEYHAGHFRGRGAAPHLRFYLPNIHKQCAYCNNALSGNVLQYRINLIKKIGLEKVEWIENHNDYNKFDREYCERIKKIFAQKTRIKKKRLGLI